MGACDFIQTAVGKDLRDAYRKAVEEAEYESGHDPYNGTISTTEGVVLFTVTAKQLKAELAQRIERAKAKLQVARKAKRTFEVEDLQDAIKNFQTTKRELKQNAYSIARALIELDRVEKRGAAGAIELTGKAAREWKERRGYKGKRVKVFVLFGIAAM